MKKTFLPLIVFMSLYFFNARVARADSFICEGLPTGDMALQLAPGTTTGDQTTLPQQRRYDASFGYKEFMVLVEQGKFDGLTVYMGHDNPILKGIMETPVDQWKSFEKRTILVGWKQDKHLDPTLQKPGTPQILIEVKTKTGHKFTIHPTMANPAKKSATNSNALPQI